MKRIECLFLKNEFIVFLLVLIGTLFFNPDFFLGRFKAAPYLFFSFSIKRKKIKTNEQIRNACKYVVWKDRKDFTADMKNIYTAPNREAAKLALDDFAEKWEDK